MIITNNTGLPEVLVNMVKNDPYSRGENVYRSVTELIAPPRQVALKRKFYDQIMIDVSDQLFLIYGRLIHTLMENSAPEDLITEERLYATVPLVNNPVRISGSFDSFDAKTGTLNDYKFITVFRFMGGVVPKEYEQQLNLYAWLWEENGNDPVKNLRITALYRDFSKHKVKEDKKYPRANVEVHSVPIWSKEERLLFIMERVALHLKAEQELPECSVEERWAEPDKWAIMKPSKEEGKKDSCKKLFLEREEAVEWPKKKDGDYIAFRPGKSKRCEAYCDASDFCTQFQNTKNPVALGELAKI